MACKTFRWTEKAFCYSEILIPVLEKTVFRSAEICILPHHQYHSWYFCGYPHFFNISLKKNRLTSGVPSSFQTGIKGFSASFPAVCTQKGTPSQIDSEKECLEGFWNWDVRFTLYCHLLRCTVIWLFVAHVVRMCFIVFSLEGLERRESISDIVLMICFGLLS